MRMLDLSHEEQTVYDLLMNINRCNFLKNCTYKQREKNKNSYYTELFRVIKNDFEMRDKVYRLLYDNLAELNQKKESA